MDAKIKLPLYKNVRYTVDAYYVKHSQDLLNLWQIVLKSLQFKLNLTPYNYIYNFTLFEE